MAKKGAKKTASRTKKTAKSSERELARREASFKVDKDKLIDDAQKEGIVVNALMGLDEVHNAIKAHRAKQKTILKDKADLVDVVAEAEESNMPKERVSYEKGKPRRLRQVFPEDFRAICEDEINKIRKVEDEIVVIFKTGGKVYYDARTFQKKECGSGK